jgi:hypothetical protein
MERPAWDTDIKCMLPVLIVTWLRPLQQFFIDKEHATWSALGNYMGSTSPDGKNPFANVVLKNSKGQI